MPHDEATNRRAQEANPDEDHRVVKESGLGGWSRGGGQVGVHRGRCGEAEWAARVHMGGQGVGGNWDMSWGVKAEYVCLRAVTVSNTPHPIGMEDFVLRGSTCELGLDSSPISRV